MAATPLKSLPGVITGSQNFQPLMCIFGVPGIGKTTLGTETENPIFIPLEDGAENVDVPRFPVAQTLDEFIGYLRHVATGDHDYQTVVIDTLNRLMDLYYQVKKDILGDRGKPMYDFVGYGGSSGWNAVAKEIKTDIMPLLVKCKRRGMLVLILAHTGEYTRNNPLGDNITVSAPSIPKYVWKDFHGDLDVIGRADYVFSTVKASDKAIKVKASTDVEVVDGKRVKVRRLMFASGIEQDCKVRIGYELPPELPMSWKAVREHLGNVTALVDEIRDLWQYLPADGEVKTLEFLGVASAADLPKASRSKLSQLRNRLIEMRDQAQAVAAMLASTEA